MRRAGKRENLVNKTEKEPPDRETVHMLLCRSFPLPFSCPFCTLACSSC